MPIRFQPLFGQILICDFPKEFTEPEMVKRRPVVCLSHKMRTRHKLVTIVPLSTTEPQAKTPYAVKIVLPSQINEKFSSTECWAKCDMLYTFSWDRFTCPYDKIGFERRYHNIVLPPGTMCEIMTGVLASMGVEGSIKYENEAFKVFDFRDLL